MKRFLSALALASVLSGCGTITVVTDPSSYSAPDGTASPRSQQSIALLNAYSETTTRPVANRVEIDLRQATDTAIAIMRRHLEKNGIKVDANAEKKVTLKIVNLTMYYMPIPFAERWRTNMDLEAAFGDGTNTSVHAEDTAMAAFRGKAALGISAEGATLFAATGMLNDKRFLDYANR